MNTSTSDVSSPGSQPPEVPAVGIARRVGALGIGLLALGAGATISFGTTLLAPVGLLVAHRVQRARGRPVTRWGSWIASASAVALGLTALGSFAAASVPSAAWRSFFASADSASIAQAKQTLPTWIDRLAPSATKRAVLETPAPPTLQAVGLIWMGLLMAAIFGAVFGTLGWIGAMFLGFYATGKWPYAAATLSGGDSATA